MNITAEDTALVVTDPQNNVLSEKGVAWGLVGESVRQHDTVEHLEQLYKPYIEDGKTIVASPHKVYGPETNDLVVQLRKRGKSKVVLAGMLANLCVESHMRELIEQGFEVAVVKDATAAPKHPELGDGYAPALTNFGFIANAVLSTAEAVKAMQSGRARTPRLAASPTHA